MLSRLKQFKGRICVHCMNNYSLTKDRTYEQLMSLGTLLFGDDFKSDEVFYSYEEYIKYMNNCDIYICSRESQTGLGAIYTCLSLGKKVYIHGKNLNWLRDYYRAIVFDTDEIDKDIPFEVFSEPLTNEEKRHNYYTIIENRKNSYSKWIDYLSFLTKTTCLQ